MQTERITFLTDPKVKVALAERAAARGITMSEYVRRKAENDDELTPEQEAEFAALIEQVNIALPQMAATLDRMSESLRATRGEIDKALRDAGLRT